MQDFQAQLLSLICQSMGIPARLFDNPEPSNRAALRLAKPPKISGWEAAKYTRPEYVVYAWKRYIQQSLN